MKKINALIVISNMEFGGAQRQIVEFVNNIDQNVFDIHVCSLSRYTPLAEQFNNNVQLHVIHKMAKFDFLVVFKLAKLIRKYKFDIIHSYLFDAEIAARLASKMSFTKNKVIGSERNANYTLKPIQKKAYRLTKNWVNKIIANSQSGADFNSEQTGQPKHKYNVVYNGVDTNRFKPRDNSLIRKKLGIGTNCKVIGMFASFKQQKNHPFLIEALTRVRAKGIQFKLLLVGDMLYGGMHGSDQYAKNIKNQINNATFAKDVIFIGNRDDIECIYPACDFTILPSLFEGTPNVVLESMACAVPCIATDVSDNNKIITHDFSGFIVKVNDVESLSHYITKLINQPELLDFMAINAKKTILKNFSSQKLAENVCKVYKEQYSELLNLTEYKVKNKKIGFFKLGSFSHTNEQVEKLLISNFPEYEIEVIDIWNDLLNIKNPLLWIYCAKDYLIGSIMGKYSFRDSVYRTSYFFNLVKEKSEKLIKQKKYYFTFQTQSFFDISCNGVNNYVYTDHAHLTNLYYPAFDKNKLYPKKWIELEKSIYNNATFNFTMSNHVSRSINEHYNCPKNKIKNVYVGSNANDYGNNSDNTRYESQNILFVGVAWERKGGPQLVEAFKKVIKVQPNATLTIVGCSPKLNIKNCTVIGRVPLSATSHYYESASIFCLPTRLEPFGIVFIEALTNKLPVVASNIGAIPDFIEEGVNGYTVDPDDIQSLADALINLLKSPSKCKRFGEAGRQLIKSRYSWKMAGKRIKETIL